MHILSLLGLLLRINDRSSGYYPFTLSNYQYQMCQRTAALPADEVVMTAKDEMSNLFSRTLYPWFSYANSEVSDFAPSDTAVVSSRLIK